MAASRYSAFAPLDEWESISGMKRAKTYIELSRGNIRGKKAGKRLLIDVQHGRVTSAACRMPRYD